MMMLRKIINVQSKHALHTLHYNTTSIPSAFTLRHKTLKIKSKAQDEGGSENVDEEGDLPKEWTRAHLTEEDVEAYFESPTFEYQRKTSSLLKRDLTYGDAYPSQSMPQLDNEMPYDEETYDAQYGVDASMSMIAQAAMKESAEREGAPSLFNRPRINTGMPTILDPVGEKFAKFEGKKFYNRHPFQYSLDYERMMDSEQAKAEFKMNLNIQLRNEEQRLEKISDDAATAAFLAAEAELFENSYSPSGMAEMERIEQYIYPELAEEGGDELVDVEDAEGALEDNEDGYALDLNEHENLNVENEVVEDEEGEELLEDGVDFEDEAVELLADEDDVTLLDGVKFWHLANKFKEQKYNNADMNRELYPEIFAEEAAPQTITRDQMGKLYIISPNDFSTYFGELGLGGQLADTFERIGQRALMIREPVLEVTDYLTKMRSNKYTRHDVNETKGFIFTGIAGGGKSSCLATAVQHAYANNFLVFYIPSLRYWTHGVHYVEPSVLLKGYFDTPVPAEQFMRHFLKANNHFLTQMKLTKNYNLPVEVGEKQPATISELIQFGLQSEDNIEVAFKLLMDELFYNKEVPMVFAIDDYNFFNDYTYFHYGNLADFDVKMPEKVHASKLTLMRGLNRILLENSPKRFFIAATSEKWPQDNPPKLDEFIFKPLNVPRYTVQELNSIVHYYKSAYYLYNHNENLIEDLIYLTGAVPSKVLHELQFH
jgi:hypothetical protein